MIYGGGAITPDVVVQPDTLSMPEQQFLKADHAQVAGVLHHALQLLDGAQGQGPPDFTVTPAWRDELYRRLTAAGVPIDTKLYVDATPEVDRVLGDRVARFAFGDSTAKRRELADDIQLVRAIDIIRKGQTQADLLATAAPSR